MLHLHLSFIDHFALTITPPLSHPRAIWRPAYHSIAWPKNHKICCVSSAQTADYPCPTRSWLNEIKNPFLLFHYATNKTTRTGLSITHSSSIDRLFRLTTYTRSTMNKLPSVGQYAIRHTRDVQRSLRNARSLCRYSCSLSLTAPEPIRPTGLGLTRVRGLPRQTNEPRAISLI